jgi:hypothetical protein
LRKSADVPGVLHAAVRQPALAASRDLTSTDRSCFPAFIILIHYIWFSGIAFPGESKALSAGSTTLSAEAIFSALNFSHDRCILAHLSSRIKTISSPTDDKRVPSQRIVSPARFLLILFCRVAPPGSPASPVLACWGKGALGVGLHLPMSRFPDPRSSALISGKFFLLWFSASSAVKRCCLSDFRDLGCSPCLRASAVGLFFRSPDARMFRFPDPRSSALISGKFSLRSLRPLR